MDKVFNCTKSEKFHKSKRKKFKSNETDTNYEEENDATQNQKLPVNSSEQDSVNIIKDKYNVPISLHMSDENSDATGIFSQLEDEDQSFESMFNNIFEQNYSRSFQSFLSKKPVGSNLKERKFFKRNKVESPKSIKTIFPTKTSLEAEDVSKVFKIISKPNYLTKSPDLTSTSKPTLKTYCNPRKSTKNCDIVESFGLPDYSIIPGETKQMRKNSVLDTECVEASEVTIFDTHYQENSSMFYNFEDSQMFNPNEELRIKVHPQVITNISSNDFDYLDAHLTSTPNRKPPRKLQNTSSKGLVHKVENNHHMVNKSDKCQKLLRISLLGMKNSKIDENIGITNNVKNTSNLVATEEPLINVPIVNMDYPSRTQNSVFNDAKKKLRSYSNCKKNIQQPRLQKKSKMSRSKSCEIIPEKPHSISSLNKTSPVEHNMYCLTLNQNIQEQSFSKETLARTHDIKLVSLINNEIENSSSSIDTFLNNQCIKSILCSNEKQKKSVCISNNYKNKKEKINLSHNLDTPKINLRSNVQSINLSDQNRACNDKEVGIIAQNRLKVQITHLKVDSKKEKNESPISNYDGFICTERPQQKINSSELQIVLTPFDMSLLKNNESWNDQGDHINDLNTACVQRVISSDSSEISNMNHFDIKNEKSGKNIVENCNSKFLKSEKCRKYEEIKNADSEVIEKDDRRDTNVMVNSISNESSNISNYSITLDVTNKCMSPQFLFNTKDNSTTLLTERLDSKESKHLKFEQTSNIEEISHTTSAIEMNTVNLNAKIYKKRKIKSKYNNKYKNSSFTKCMSVKGSLLLKQSNANIQILKKISTDHESQGSINNYLSEKNSIDSVQSGTSSDINGKYSEELLEKVHKGQCGKIKDIVLLKSAKVNRKRGRPRKNSFKISQPKKKTMKHMILRTKASVRNPNFSAILGSVNTVVKQQTSNISHQYKINHEEKKKGKHFQNMYKPMCSSIPLNIDSEEISSCKTNIIGTNLNGSISENDFFLHVTQSTKTNEQSPQDLRISSESLNVSDTILTPHKKRGRPKSRKLCLVSNIAGHNVEADIQQKKAEIEGTNIKLARTSKKEKIYLKSSSEISDSNLICNNLANVSSNSLNDVLELTTVFDFDINKRQTRKSILNKNQCIYKDFEKELIHGENEFSINETVSLKLLENKTRKENFNGIISDVLDKEGYESDNVSQKTSVENTYLDKTILEESGSTQKNKNNSYHNIKSGFLVDSTDISDNKLDVNVSQSLEEKKIFENLAGVISKNNDVISNQDQQSMHSGSKGMLKIKLSPQKSSIFLRDKSRNTFLRNSDKANKFFEDDISDLKDIVQGNYSLRSKSSLGERLSDIEIKKSQETSNSPSSIESETRIRCNSVVPRLYYVSEKNNVKTAIDIEKFKIGFLVWGQIGYHPYWPCLITKEPGSGQFKKQLPFKNSSQRILYHVRFFGDNGRRAWISHNRLMPYHNQDDLDNAYEKLKAEPHTKFELLVYKVKPSNMHKWLTAVEEAEAVKTKTLKEKLRFFDEVLSKKIAKTNISQNIMRTNVLSIPKRKYKQEKIIHSDSESHSNSDKKSPMYKKQKIETPTDLSKQNCIPEPSSELQILNHENVETSPLREKKIDEHSEVASKTSSENATTDSDSLESQKRLFKRNNLFRGLSREKVCQFCFEGGEVLKCTSHCNGFYHVDCATELLDKNIKKKNTDTVVLSKNSSIQNIHGRNQNSEESKTAFEHNPKHKVVNKEIIDDHVQIITVPSNIYNTPPRKTFPPNFKNMSLAEQIDYKMKEIMRKFESKTTYAESTTDSSSEENSIQPQTTSLSLPDSPKLQNGSNLRLREKEFPKLTYTVHITADSFHALTRPPKKEMLKNVSVKVPDKKELMPSESYEHLISVCSTSMEGQDFKQFEVEKINPKQFKCGFCTAHVDPYCFICHQAISKKSFNFRQKCSLYWCGRFYHPECLKLWPQTQWSLIQMTKPKYSEEAVDSFVCPQHVCHTCASENPRAAMSRCTSDKIVRCLLCPASYHSTNLCIPAGTEILSITQIVCPRHGKHRRTPTINTTWCFLCSEGGNLICCETCPTSVHPECLPVNLTEDDKFICEDCESGRLPLYDEIVWVKLGKYRWWPAVILFPNEVPHNIMNVKHNRGDFVVKFFGTYDYYWVNKGRSFLFQDGDKGCCSNVKKRFDEAFNKAVEEAIVAHKLKKEFKLTQEVESLNSQKPPPYIKIKVNKAVGNVKLLDLDLSNTTPCECDPSHPHPCGPDTDCLNRLLLTECNPEVCPAGQRCKNQSFEKREYPPLVPYKTLGKGWGLKSLAPIKKCQFIIEYVGEMIDDEEYQRRIQKMHEQKEENYYFLTIDKDRMIDAGPKGNLARFMNHCCQPNCETQKWTVNGNTRVGLFATEDISAETELTFNYNLECIGKEKKVCRCGAPNCSGFIGVKAKQDTEIKKNKKSYKKKKAVEPSVLLPCFICNKKGNVGVCNNKICNKTYHLRCLKMSSWPEGSRFVCPWHNCNICSKRTIRCCVKCINSFCPSHSEGNIRYDNLHGFVCNSHDPTKPPEDQPIKIKRGGRGNKITDESAVTSTTSDDMDNDYEKSNHTPLNQIKRRKTSKKGQLLESDIEDIDVNATVTSTPLRKSTLQDENEVSSASASSLDYEAPVNHTMTSKPVNIKKKLRLRNIQSYNVTANSSSNKVHID